MKRTERIQKMEQALDASAAAVKKLSEAMDEYERAQKDIKNLFDYYGSVLWMQDYEADEAGKLPEDLPRGVLSEDAVYDLITEHRDLMARLSKAVTATLEKNML